MYINKIFGLTLSGLCLSLLVITNAQAHGIWFAERAQQTALIYGVGADDLDTVKRLPLMESINGYDDDWNQVETKLMPAGPLLLAVSDDLPSYYTATMNNGIWSKTADGKWHKKGKDELPEAIISERTRKYAVYLREPLTTELPALPDQTLQIIPMGPIPEMMGKRMKIKVLFNGEPVRGARIKRDIVNDPDAKPIITRKDGTARIKVRNQGLNVIMAIYDGPADDPIKVTKVEHSASLSFVLEHLPE